MNWNFTQNDLPKIIGAKVVSFDATEDEIVIVFDNGIVLVGTPYGDCCSHTWIEHCEGVTGGTLIAMKEVDGKEITPEMEEGHDVLQTYCTTFETTKGDIQIDYRNDSNGYYGGSIDWNLQ